MIPDIEKRINRHTEAVKQRLLPAPTDPCPRCGETPERFSLHERRWRAFRFVVEGLIRIVFTLLERWKCLLCGKTFTRYPDFAAPHKRYVVSDIYERGSSYVQDDEQTYRMGVKEQGRPIGYGSTPEGAMDERRLEPSTLWRWVGYLGSLKDALRELLRLIREKDPSSPIFREGLPIPPWKYHTEPRHLLLQRVRMLLSAEAEMGRLFGVRVFPRYATAPAPI